MHVIHIVEAQKMKMQQRTIEYSYADAHTHVSPTTIS